MDAHSPGAFHGGRFRAIEEAGVGAYGSVYKALDIDDNKIVAIKTVRRFDSKEALPLSFFRESKLLQEIRHENVVSFLGTFRDKNVVFLAMEYCETDLQQQAASQPSFSAAQVKSLIFQLLKGLDAIHSLGYAHRDIKPANLLIKDGLTLKIADFGLSRPLDNSRLTPRVAALAYRAPELIFGARSYSNSVDIWSAGVTFYELATGEKFPSAPTDLGQLDKIFSLCGFPKDDSPLMELPNWKLATMLRVYPRVLEEVLLEKIPVELHAAIPLISAMLSLDPSSRPSADQLLSDPFFNVIEKPERLLVPEPIYASSGETSPRSPLARPVPLLLEVA